MAMLTMLTFAMQGNRVHGLGFRLVFPRHPIHYADLSPKSLGKPKQHTNSAIKP